MSSVRAEKGLSFWLAGEMGFSLSAQKNPLPLVLLCALLWGSAFPVIKQVYAYWEGIGLQRTLPMVLLFAGIRFSIAGSGLLLLGEGLRRELRATPWRPLAVFALAQTFLQYLFFYEAIAVSSASLAALLVATGSFWWMLLAPIMQGSPWPTRRQWCGLAIGGAGVALAVYKPGAGAGNPLLGAALMLAATASGAIGIIVFQRIRPTMGAVNATGLSLLLGGLGLVAAGSSELGAIPQMISVPVAVATVWLAFVSATAFSVWNHLSTVYPVALLASYRFLIPVCGVLEAQLFLSGESAGWGLLIGGALVVVSLSVARRAGSGGRGGVG